MSRRTRTNWVVLEGGPLHGQHRVVFPHEGPVTIDADSGAGAHTPHEYMQTDEYRRERCGTGQMATYRVARFVRTLPERPRPHAAIPPCPGQPLC